MKRLLMSSAAVLATLAFASAQDASQTNNAGAAKPSTPATQSANQNPSSSNDAIRQGGQKADHGANAAQDAQPSQRKAEGAQDKSRDRAQLGGEEQNKKGAEAQRRGDNQDARQSGKDPRGQQADKGSNVNKDAQPSTQGRRCSSEVSRQRTGKGRQPG